MQASGRAEWYKQQASWGTGKCGSHLKIFRLFSENRSYQRNKRVSHGLTVGYKPHSLLHPQTARGSQVCWGSKSNKIHLGMSSNPFIPPMALSPNYPIATGLADGYMKAKLSPFQLDEY